MMFRSGSAEPGISIVFVLRNAATVYRGRMVDDRYRIVGNPRHGSEEWLVDARPGAEMGCRRQRHYQFALRFRTVKKLAANIKAVSVAAFTGSSRGTGNELTLPLMEKLGPSFDYLQEFRQRSNPIVCRRFLNFAANRRPRSPSLLGIVLPRPALL